MLATTLRCWWRVLPILSPISKFYHKHPKIVTNLKSPTSTGHQHLCSRILKILPVVLVHQHVNERFEFFDELLLILFERWIDHCQALHCNCSHGEYVWNLKDTSVILKLSKNRFFHLRIHQSYEIIFVLGTFQLDFEEIQNSHDILKDEEPIRNFEIKNWPKYTAFCHLFIVY